MAGFTINPQTVELLDMLGLPDRFTPAYSRGQQQRQPQQQQRPGVFSNLAAGIASGFSALAQGVSAGFSALAGGRGGDGSALNSSAAASSAATEDVVMTPAATDSASAGHAPAANPEEIDLSDMDLDSALAAAGAKSGAATAASTPAKNAEEIDLGKLG